MKNAEVMKRMAEGGVSVVVSRSPEEFFLFNKTEIERFAVLIKEAKITVE